MKILLFGSTGQVGWELQRSLAPLGEVIAPTREGSTDAPNPLHADFGDPDKLAETVERVEPQLIINAAAYTGVDEAEGEPELVDRINCDAPGVLARAAAARGAWLVHYSTDFVFDGSGSRPWTEKDATGPLSAYGRSKLKGERLVARQCARHLILRTSWVYGAGQSMFPWKILQAAAQRERLEVVDDQHGAPTGADLIADLTAHAIVQVLADPAKAGLYHLTASGETHRNAYARFLVGEASRLGLEMKATPEQIAGIPSSARPSAAKRPRNSRLDCTKFRQTFGLHLPAWEHGVRRWLKVYLGDRLTDPSG